MWLFKCISCHFTWLCYFVTTLTLQKISDKPTVFAKMLCFEDFFLRKTCLLIEFTQLNKQWLNELTSKNIDAKLTTSKIYIINLHRSKLSIDICSILTNSDSKFAMCNFSEKLTLRQRIVQKKSSKYIIQEENVCHKEHFKILSRSLTYLLDTSTSPIS